MQSDVRVTLVWRYFACMLLVQKRAAAFWTSCRFCGSQSAPDMLKLLLPVRNVISVSLSLTGAAGVARTRALKKKNLNFIQVLEGSFAPFVHHPPWRLNTLLCLDGNSITVISSLRAPPGDSGRTIFRKTDPNSIIIIMSDWKFNANFTVGLKNLLLLVKWQRVKGKMTPKPQTWGILWSGELLTLILLHLSNYRAWKYLKSMFWPVQEGEKQGQGRLRAVSKIKRSENFTSSWSNF